ncbi:MAG: flagellar assembly protein FliX [Devosiaceae bacterium]|nr:flagellar assembly protein FliX [Devosiaceae bacterium MH13]
MRVEGPKGPAAGVQSRNGKGSGSGSGFSLPSAASPSSAANAGGTPATAAVHDLDALLALQTVEDEGDRRRRAVRHGHDLLDQLEALRADLLAGRVAPQRLSGLAVLVRAKQATEDPQLQAVVDDIALRAKVELAKLGIDP